MFCQLTNCWYKPGVLGTKALGTRTKMLKADFSENESWVIFHKIPKIPTCAKPVRAKNPRWPLKILSIYFHFKNVVYVSLENDMKNVAIT